MKEKLREFECTLEGRPGACGYASWEHVGGGGGRMIVGKNIEYSITSKFKEREKNISFFPGPDESLSYGQIRLNLEFNSPS